VITIRGESYRLEEKGRAGILAASNQRDCKLDPITARRQSLMSLDTRHLGAITRMHLTAS
jgi:hypothetical protein